MKKTSYRILSVLLAVLTCASMMAFCVSAGVNGTENAKVSIDYIDVAPTMDGVITTEEWGEPLAHVLVGMARKNYAFDENNNVAVSDYCYLDQGQLKYINPMNFDLFVRWDTDNLYIGMIADDPYGFSVVKNLVDGKTGKLVDRWTDYLDGGKYYPILYWVYNACNDLTPWYDKDGVPTAGTDKNCYVRYYGDDPATTEIVETEAEVLTSAFNGRMIYTGQKGEIVGIGSLWHGDAIQFGINSADQGVNAGGKNAPFTGTPDAGDTYIFSTHEGKGYLMSDKFGMLVEDTGAISWNSELYAGGTDWMMCGKSGGVQNNVGGYLTFEFAVPAWVYDANGKNETNDVIGLTVARVSGTTDGEVELAGGTAKNFPRGNKASGDYTFVEGSTTKVVAGSLNEMNGGYESWISWGDGVMGSAADQPTNFRSGANEVTLVGGPSEPPTPSVLRGDVNGDGVLTNADAIYLLRNIMLGDSYPINQGGDMNGDGTITNADAIYLLRNIMLGDSYPLAPDTL